MSARFSTIALAGGNVLVKGTDVLGTTGQQVLNGTYWESKRLEREKTEALGLVDDAIEQLLAPIQAAVDEANARLKRPSLDPLFYIEVQEEIEATPGQRGIIDKLDNDSVILRALEEGQEDRLIWVNDKLVVTAAPAATAVPSLAEDDAATV